jgi:hypothetical protein
MKLSREAAAGLDRYVNSPFRRKKYTGSLDVLAIEWAISLLEIHQGVQVNPNSQMWLDRLRANLHHHKLDQQRATPSRNGNDSEHGGAR